MPIVGIVGHLESQWRVIAARQRQQQLGKRGSADFDATGDALGDSPKGSSGIVGVQRLWRFGCCCTWPAWQRAAGRCAGWLAMATMVAHRGATRSGARVHKVSEAPRRSARPGSSMGGTCRVSMTMHFGAHRNFIYSLDNISNNNIKQPILLSLLSVVSAVVQTTVQTTAIPSRGRATQIE